MSSVTATVAGLFLLAAVGLTEGTAPSSSSDSSGSDSSVAGNSYPPCSNEVACNGNAWDAYDASTYNSSLPAGSCVCMCNYGYTGDSCDSCDSYAAYIGYPKCVFNSSTCSIGDYCAAGGNTLDVKLSSGSIGGASSCKCTCASGFSGLRCDRCGRKYENYPTCSKKPDECFVEDDCAGSTQAWIVHGNKSAGCTCGCRDNYAGLTCNRCVDYHYINYPHCTYNQSTCTVDDWCNGNAETSTLEYGSCGCRCKEGFTGVRCHYCRSGYYNYPMCLPATGSASAGASSSARIGSQLTASASSFSLQTVSFSSSSSHFHSVAPLSLQSSATSSQSPAPPPLTTSFESQVTDALDSLEFDTTTLLSSGAATLSPSLRGGGNASQHLVPLVALLLVLF